MNMIHTIIQGAGRTGRPVPDEPGVSTRALVYILGNGGDVGAQVKGMSGEMRELVGYKGGCLRVLIGNHFLGSQSEINRNADWCCSFCSA